MPELVQWQRSHLTPLRPGFDSRRVQRYFWFFGGLLATAWSVSHVIHAVPRRCVYYCSRVGIDQKMSDFDDSKQYNGYFCTGRSTRISLCVWDWRITLDIRWNSHILMLFNTYTRAGALTEYAEVKSVRGRGVAGLVSITKCLNTWTKGRPHFFKFSQYWENGEIYAVRAYIWGPRAV